MRITNKRNNKSLNRRGKKRCSTMNLLSCGAISLVVIYLFFVVYMMTTQQLNNSQPSNTFSGNIKNDLLLGIAHVTSDTVWEQLLEEAGALLKQPQQEKRLVAMEAGMHVANQCLMASRKGLQAHCFEPSPKSYARIVDQIKRVQDAPTVERTHTYNMAAGPKSNEFVEFTSTGGTGDHVGVGMNMYNMSESANNNIGEEVTVTKVPTIALDDIVDKLSNAGDEIFLLKVDTQGFEPSVFRGLEKSIKAGKIPFILSEYWPKGIDLLGKEAPNTCAAARLLETLSRAGYDLYQMTVIAHPDAGPRRNFIAEQGKRPLDNLIQNCQWYLDLDKKIDYNPNYRMGYWTDILAVAPGALHYLDKKPYTTLLGKVLSCRGDKTCLPKKPVNPSRCQQSYEKEYDPGCSFLCKDWPLLPICQ